MRKPTRNYTKILNEFANTQSPFDFELLGTVVYNNVGYPFISFHTHSKLAKWNVVINSGAHGTEATGIKVLLRFLQEFNKELLNENNFILFPIVNPFGYRFNCRKNGCNQYGNSGFNQVKEENLTFESKLIKEALPNRIDLFIDIHADNKSGFYIYERKRPNKESLAEVSLNILKQNKICVLEHDTVYREKCVNGVVISPIRDGSMDNSMFERGAVYSLCIEIPTKIPEDQQIVGGLLLLNEILNHYKRLVINNKL